MVHLVHTVLLDIVSIIHQDKLDCKAHLSDDPHPHICSTRTAVLSLKVLYHRRGCKISF